MGEIEVQAVDMHQMRRDQDKYDDSNDEQYKGSYATTTKSYDVMSMNRRHGFSLSQDMRFSTQTN